MRITYSILVACVFLVLSLGLFGCAPPPPTQPAALPYHKESLYNYYLGKHYMSQGRLELARERFALAHTPASNTEFKYRCSQDLTIVNAMLQTRRMNTHAY